MRRVTRITTVGLLLLPFAGFTQEGQEKHPGEAVFANSCASCHSSAQSGRTPSAFMLSTLTPQAILASLESGIMRAEGSKLSAEQRLAVAEGLSGKTLATATLPEEAYCSNRGFLEIDTNEISFMGFGGNYAGTGMQGTQAAGISADQVSDLDLQWAFAMPGVSQVRSKPTVVGDTLIFGDALGTVYALDADSGCVQWNYLADSSIRGSVVLGETPDDDTLAWFVDFNTNVYALNVSDGTLAWKTRVGDHPEASITGSTVLHDGKLIVPVSNMGVATAMDPAYECCTGSGAVVALDATTGDLIWRLRTIGEEAKPTHKNSIGTQLYGPSGATVWSSPTIDVDRGRVYVGTGENLTVPTTDTSDAILAIDIDSGDLLWSFQGTPEDAFTMACGRRESGPNCPEPAGPDLDFGMAPILVTREDGKEILVAGQKSGVVWALDPDNDGAVLWSKRIGKGGALGGIHWGMATDGKHAYATVADRADAVIVDVNPDRPVSPGVYAIDLISGDITWSTPAPEDTCLGKQGCMVANSAAPTMIPGVVFAGGLDGYIRAYSTKDGSIVWQYDTTGEYESVSGISGRGGAIDGPGPVIANGTLYVNSGYGMFGQMPGNVLLAFRVTE